MVNGLGQRLQQQRILMNISQKQAALAIDVSASIISNYESGERTPSVEKLMALAGLYRCSVDYLLGIDKTDSIHIDVSMLNEQQIHLLQNFLSGLRK